MFDVFFSWRYSWNRLGGPIASDEWHAFIILCIQKGEKRNCIHSMLTSLLSSFPFFGVRHPLETEFIVFILAHRRIFGFLSLSFLKCQDFSHYYHDKRDPTAVQRPTLTSQSWNLQYDVLCCGQPRSTNDALRGSAIRTKTNVHSSGWPYETQFDDARAHSLPFGSRLQEHKPASPTVVEKCNLKLVTICIPNEAVLIWLALTIHTVCWRYLRNVAIRLDLDIVIILRCV